MGLPIEVSFELVLEWNLRYVCTSVHFSQCPGFGNSALYRTVGPNASKYPGWKLFRAQSYKTFKCLVRRLTKES